MCDSPVHLQGLSHPFTPSAGQYRALTTLQISGGRVAHEAFRGRASAQRDTAPRHGALTVAYSLDIASCFLTVVIAGRVEM